MGKALGRSIREFKNANKDEKKDEQMINVTEQPKELADKTDEKK